MARATAMGTYSGDGGAAINAGLNNPNGLALDAAGNLYIADQGNNRIRKVGPTASSPPWRAMALGSYAGDGGAATNASLYYPSGVALDASGNLYIADHANSRIRKVGTNGIITTVAGNGGYGYSGDGGAATNASLEYAHRRGLGYRGQPLYCRHRQSTASVGWTPTASSPRGGQWHQRPVGDGGAATNASLIYPYGIALDAAGNLYIADFGNERIRKVDTNGIITTVAGNGSSGYLRGWRRGHQRQSGSSHSVWPLIWPAICILLTPATCDPRSPFCWLSRFHADQHERHQRRQLLRGHHQSLRQRDQRGGVADVYLPTVITAQPASQFAVAGTNAVFSVAATGSGPFGYEWYWAGTNLVQSGTNSSLTLPDVTTNNAGNYTVVVTNAYGSVTSQVATLTVGCPPR